MGGGPVCDRGWVTDWWFCCNPPLLLHKSFPIAELEKVFLNRIWCHHIMQSTTYNLPALSSIIATPQIFTALRIESDVFTYCIPKWLYVKKHNMIICNTITFSIKAPQIVLFAEFKHCQRHNGPEGWVHITSLQLTVHKSWSNYNFRTLIKH